MDEFGLSRAVISGFQSRHEFLEIPATTASAICTFEDPLLLLHALGQFRAGDFELIFLDLPRASKRVKVSLPTLDSTGNVIWTDVSHDDPDYLFRLKSNALVTIRLAARCLSAQGLLLAIATPDTYIPVRTSIEQFLGHTGFLGELVYQTRTGGANDSKYMDVGHETLLVYARDPSRISGFYITKNQEELKKYSQEDEQGRYYWDTYKRKQARNYYRIKCPDGTYLENDEFGNRISWLWKEETFLRKLAEGEVKFERQDDQWRLYFKDRLKELKILRSLVLNNTELLDVSENSETKSSGAGLLTQRGSAEIKGFAGPKPEYLKSSEFFRFILEVFGRSKRVLVPFNEYGAALCAHLANNKLASQIFVNNKREHEPLISWRASLIDQLSPHEYEISPPLMAFDVTSLENTDKRVASFIQNFVANSDHETSDWFEVSSDSYKLLICEGASLHVIVESIDVNSHREPLNLPEYLTNLGFDTKRPFIVWSSLNEDVIRASFPDLANLRVMIFPLFLIQ